MIDNNMYAQSCVYKFHGYDQIQIYYRSFIYKYKSKIFTVQLIDMLRQTGILPPQSQGCFYDYLTGITYTSIDGQLHLCDPNSGNQTIPLTLFQVPKGNPQNYLHRLVSVQGSAIINTEGTIATNNLNQNAIVRSIRSISDRASWQFHIPNSLYGIQLGICHLGQNGALQYLNFTFNSSTSRTVTFVVDGTELKAWVNQSAFSKKNSKQIKWPLNQCYPYAHLTSQGTSVIFNPFSVQPNTKISKYNPFNFIQKSQKSIDLLTKAEVKLPDHIKIKDIKQISKDTMLLVGQGGYARLHFRNPETNKFQFNNFVVHQGVAWNLFKQSEWNRLSELASDLKLPNIQWQNQGYKLQQVFNLIKHLITSYSTQKSDRCEFIYLLLTKLSILRPYINEKIPNSIINCEIDRQQHHYSHQFFKNHNSVPLRVIPAQIITNSLGWSKVQGRIVQTSKNYLMSIKKGQSNSQQYQLSIYHFNQLGISSVLSKNLSEQQQFFKSKLLQGYSDSQTNLWKENNKEGLQIYKILTNCFSNQKPFDNSAYEIKEKDINQLVDIFKIPKEDAISSLEQNGNIQDALAWLADKNRKVTRKSKRKKELQNDKNIIGQDINCSFVELPTKNIVTQLLVHLNNTIYVIGFNPRIFSTLYAKKTEKGFMNLSRYEYGVNLSEIDDEFIHKGINHGELSVLDQIKFTPNEITIKNPLVFLFSSKEKLYLAEKNEQTISKISLEFNEQNIYKEASSLKIVNDSEKLCPTSEKASLVKTAFGELHILSEGAQNTYLPFTALSVNGKTYSNYKAHQADQSESIAQVWVKCQNLQLQFNQNQQSSESKFLPLLVERGPPGCNMNYPICSILYPKASLPFLANYPYSLTFRHLHSKCMKVTQVVIQRIGEKHNVNQIKEGSIYFIDDSNIKSKRYKFRFENKNELKVEINQQCFWRYMVIQPTYSTGSKLPYEIGFLGAKGTSIEQEQYQQALSQKIEQSLQVLQKGNKCRFELIKIDSVTESTYKATLLLNPGQKKCSQLTIKSKSQNLTISGVNTRIQSSNVKTQIKQKEQDQLKNSKIASMTPGQVISYISKVKNLAKSKQGRLSNTVLILRQISKNQSMSLKDYDQNQIKILVDMFISSSDLSIKDFQKLYEKIRSESPQGYKYLHELILDLGKGYLVIDPKHMQSLLGKIITKQDPSTFQNILTDLLSNVLKLRNTNHYNILQKEYNTPYLILQTDYYSKYYYNQIQGVDQQNTTLARCDPIFKQEPINMFKFVTIKQNNYRKIIVRFQEKISVRDIVLRLDKSQSHNKAFVNVSAWVGNKKQTFAQCVIHEHQWIQVTKNPYRKQMGNMFGSNHTWLNAYGINLSQRVQTNYLQIQIIFSLGSTSTKQINSGNLVEIIPQIYGYSCGSGQQMTEIDESYFKYNEEQKIFLSKMPSKLQIESQSGNKQSIQFSKYLITKHNRQEYNLYESRDASANQSQVQRDQTALQLIEQVKNLVSTQQMGQKKRNQKDINPILEQYHKIMKNITQKNNHIKLSSKLNLDYCFTLIMWILDILGKKQIGVGQKIGHRLIQTIVKMEIGPITYSCIKAICKYPDLLIQSLNYIKISSQDDKGSFNAISSSFIKGNTQINISESNIKKALQLKDPRLGQSLINIIIDSKNPNEESIKQCIQLSKLAGKHERIINYILKSQQENKETKQKSRQLFSTNYSEHLNQEIINYIFSKQVPQKLRNQNFVHKLECKQLQRLILQIRKLKNKKKTEINPSNLLHSFMSNKEVQSIHLDIISLIFQLNLSSNQQWDYLEKCIKLCPAAEHMIHSQYLSSSRQQKQQLLELATFHRDILLSAAKSQKNTELLVNFLGEVYFCSKEVFIETIMSLPDTEGEMHPLHSDIYSIIISILSQQCNLGGVQGAKCASQGQSVWLGVVVKLFKFSNKNIAENQFSQSEMEAILRWYLLNNEYQQHLSNPIHRSQTINNMKQLGEYLSEMIKKIGGGRNIKKLFTIYAEIKEQIKKDKKKLLNTKYLILSRLQYGVFKLMESNLEPKNLQEVLIGSSDTKGLAEQIINELQEEQQQEASKPKNSQSRKQVDLTDEVQAYSIQGANLVNLGCKDLQSYKNGSKSHIAKVSVASKKLYLKSPSTMYMSKFIIGFSVQQSPDKNNILPDSVQLFGSKVDEVPTTPESMKKICDLQPIEDQHYAQFGIKLFGINFDCLRRKYRNQPFNFLQLRMKHFVQTSTSDVLECNQKILKNSVYHVTFVSINGHKQQPSSQLSFSNIYMKMLTFLSGPEYEQALINFIKHVDTKKGMMIKLVELLSQKAQKKTNDNNIQNLLISFSKHGVPVLQFLLKQSEQNQSLANKILKSNLSVDNIDLALNNLFTGTIKQQNVNHLIQNIKIAGLKQNIKHSRYEQKQILQLCHKYEKCVQKHNSQQKTSSNQQYQQLRKILACMTTTPKLFKLDPVELTEKLTKNKNNSVFYPIIASYIVNDNKSLDWLLKSGKVDELSDSLLVQMQIYKNNKTKQIQSNILNIVSLISAVSIYPPIRQRLINNPDKKQITRLPIKVFKLLSNNQTLIEQYPISITKKFLNLFQSTCTKSGDQNLDSCSEQFASNLIDVMVKLPQVSSVYHNYFIHQFFFHIINAYNGVLVNFVWVGQVHNYLTKPTEILEKYPIRKNETILEHKHNYYKQALTKQDLVNNHNKIIVNNNKIIWQRTDKWNLVQEIQNSQEQVKQVVEQNKSIKLLLKNGNTKELNINDSTSGFKCFVNDPQIYGELRKLLTNQTLLRINKPSLFANKYNSNLPITLGMLPYIYLVPAQMTIAEMLKQVNICGYVLDNDAKDNINVHLHNKTRDAVNQKQKLSNVFDLASSSKPIIQLEIRAHQLFKTTTIQKIANQSSVPQKTPKFIPQQTIFKSFEKLKGLQKMIKVIMACVKNWNNEQQSKIWSQYLNELSSFSCFPIFSSIYMNKQENVELLFNLLSGLPDKEDNKKWIQEQKKSVRFLYDIIKNVFEVQGQQAIIVRNYAVESGFYETMLQRLHIITKQTKRVKNQQTKQQEVIQAPTEIKKKNSQQQFKKQIKKKKGVGYGNDSSSNQKWDIAGHQSAKKQLSEQIIGLIKILEKFLSHSSFKLPAEFLETTYTSSILPILESSLRAGSLLQISKNADLFKQELRFIKTIAKNQTLVPSLLQIPKCYEPKQLDSIFSLLTTLEGISKIFLNCLTGSVSEKTSEQIAKQIIQTYNQVEQAIEHYKSDHVDQQADKKLLELPLAKKYPLLLKDLRFDYIDMKDKNGKMKHHYNSSYQANHTSPSTKTIRLAQQLADISQALPIEHTNAIYVRCDKDRVDFMQALIMGSNGTPYGHGAYLFDIYFDDSYPNNPPKVNLTTTGNGAIRFNPNLYNCGKVCLSLLGTWRGSAMENWDAKVSTLLQVLVSIQSIIMAQQIYFNQPGFEHEQGTAEGQKKNEGYSNIVRYGNVKFAMIQNLKNPPKGFETVIKRHFYLKKDEILEQCKKWVKYAEKREASYTGLVNDHNNNWSNTFKKSKTQYKTMLQKAISELQVQLNKLPEPSAKDLIKEKTKNKKQKKQKKQVKVEKDENLQEIDVTYDPKNNTKYKQLDINDEKVKDRWSRYIGAMGLQAVSKQSKANILMFGLSPLGIQIGKNIVMSGCKKFTVCDPQVTTWNDLSGQFYLSEDDIGKGRLESCLYKLQELNNYVRVDSMKVELQKLEQQNKLKQYQVVITTIHNDQQIILLDNYCRKNGIRFIACKCQGPYGYVFNDFGEKFEVIDKNGEQPVQCFIQNITNQQNGLVTLMKGQKHNYEDGDMVRITKVKGMQQKTNQQKSINETVHKIKIISQSVFKIENTTSYNQYAGNGLVKNIKVPINLEFKSYQESLKLLNIDANLMYYDFSKSVNNKLLHLCFRTLSVYRKQQKGQSPRPWNWEDAQKFLSLYEKVTKQFSSEQQKTQLSDSDKSFIVKFSLTCSGSFAPLAAFYGGLVAQEAFKAITSKYMPINQLFLTDFTEVIDTLPKQFSEWKQFIQNKQYKQKVDRFEGLRRIVGDDTLEKIRDCKVFVIGSGAIGCELLKNYAMINLATSQKADKGTIVVTDPDHIQTSNLNRQFLFRQKHLQKPKSSTAAAVVKQMNKYLKGQNKIRAKLIKVCQATKDTFSNQFFESMDIVTNALDNVQARQYVDLRCVENKVALLESGTLSTKGHVQVIIPYKTQTYGSKADPAEEGDIPHCTLKMFPEQTLHCVEWARDIFGKTFSMKPKALIKILQSIDTYTPSQSQTAVLKDSLQMLKQKPNNFDDAVYVAVKQFYKFYRNDIKQLLYTYPLDAKTKDGKDFWKLPKRPPTPIQQISLDDGLHADFINSYAVLLCKIFNIPYPKDFRTQKAKKQVITQAIKIKIDPFVPSDKLAKQMATEVEQNKQANKQKQQQITQKQEMTQNQSYIDLFKQIQQIYNEEKQLGNILKINAEEFQKDDDTNGHIDLIYSMANLRASNYKLDPMDWITTKLKAGRITPALSTTTSCIAALQTIQLIKYLKKLPTDQMKNSFINLAVPIVQTGEPGQLDKIKIHEQLTTNIWQRWSLDQVNLNEIVIGELLKLIEQKYKINVKILNILGGGPIYSDLVLGLESKKQQKELFMKKKLKDALSDEGAVEQFKNFIDLTLVMAVGEQFIKHVPTLRINFKK